MARTHTMQPNDFMVTLNTWTLELVMMMEFEFSRPVNEAVLASFPGLYQDAKALHDRFDDYDPQKGIQLTDKEIYTFYIGYDFVGRLLVSDFREAIMRSFKAGQEGDDGETDAFFRATIKHISPMLRDMESYAKETKSLPALAEVKRKLANLPPFH